MSGRVRIVVFDWGGVILRICRSWREGCGRAGLEVREGSDDERLAAERRRIAQAYQIGSIGCDDFCASLSDTMDGLYTPSEVRRIHDSWLIEEYPGVDEIVSRLVESESVATGMLSNTNRLHWRQQLRADEGGTSRFPTARLLEHRHASHLLGIAKPDGGIFDRFESETGFRGGEILFFDDLPDNVASAQRAGWCAERIDHEGDTAAQIAGHLASHGVR